jgi:hypothetical protein
MNVFDWLIVSFIVMLLGLVLFLPKRNRSGACQCGSCSKDCIKRDLNDGKE